MHKRLILYVTFFYLMNENTNTKKINILIVFYTRYGNTARMADEISIGV